MTQRQLKQLSEFCQPYYRATGRWHGWDHITAVKKHALNIAKDYPDVNLPCLEAAALIHDMGRIIQDDGHGAISAQIAAPFLDAIGVPKGEIKIIVDAAAHHELGQIDKAKTLEAKLLFDADKIEILTVYGFMRVAFWLTEEREMELGKAVNFLWDYCRRFRKKLYSNYAKKLVTKEWPLLVKLVQQFNAYEKTWRKR